MDATKKKGESKVQSKKRYEVLYLAEIFTKIIYISAKNKAKAVLKSSLTAHRLTDFIYWNCQNL